MTTEPPSPPIGSFHPRGITRPDPALMRYYVVASLFTFLAFPFVLTAMWFRYLTLRYRFDDEGVWMGVGLLFKRETNVAYRRIQDIHVTRGLVQRWFGLATVSIQTASGSASAEMSIEGVMEAEQLRDFLYARMRGARGLDHAADAPPASAPGGVDAGAASTPASDEALAILRDIRDALRDRRERGETKGPPA